jgi:hypothetical protein
MPIIFSPFNHVPKEVYACLTRVRKHFYLRQHIHGFIGHNLQGVFLVNLIKEKNYPYEKDFTVLGTNSIMM